MGLLTFKISEINWEQTHDLIEIIVIIFQLLITSLLTWKLIIQADKSNKNTTKQKELEFKIQLFDKRIEIYTIGNYIKNILYYLCL